MSHYSVGNTEYRPADGDVAHSHTNFQSGREKGQEEEEPFQHDAATAVPSDPGITVDDSNLHLYQVCAVASISHVVHSRVSRFYLSLAPSNDH